MRESTIIQHQIHAVNPVMGSHLANARDSFQPRLIGTKPLCKAETRRQSWINYIYTRIWCGSKGRCVTCTWAAQNFLHKKEIPFSKFFQIPWTWIFARKLKEWSENKKKYLCCPFPVLVEALLVSLGFPPFHEPEHLYLKGVITHHQMAPQGSLKQLLFDSRNSSQA